MARPKKADIEILKREWLHLVSQEKLKLVEERNQFQLEQARAREEHQRQATVLANMRRDLERQQRVLEQLMAEYAAKPRPTTAERRKLESERAQLERERRAFEQARQEFEQRQRGSSCTPRDERHYGRILGLSGKVTFSEIKRAYHVEAARCHPDRVQMMHPEIIELATRKMREVNEAWEHFRSRYS